MSKWNDLADALGPHGGTYMADEVRAVVRRMLADAWDEGASSCHSFAFSDGECACGNYPGERNPYCGDEAC